MPDIIRASLTGRGAMILTGDLAEAGRHQQSPGAGTPGALSG